MSKIIYKNIFICFSICVFMFFTSASTSTFISTSTAQAQDVFDGIGVQIHFTGARSGDISKIKDEGFKKIRMDLFWNRCEKQKNVYTFKEYDDLLSTLKANGISPVFTLDFGNPLYGEQWSIRQTTTMTAFANFAAAAVAHFKNEKIVWELWNEPNIDQFWQPKANVNEYMTFAKAVIPKMRAANPNAYIVAPAVSQMDYTFLEQCFNQGLLGLVNGITVHPYRPDTPETFVGDYIKLKNLIATYNTANKKIDILSGEWGYPSRTYNSTEAIQAKYLTRMFLVNSYLNIPTSIWYDWQDDGTDPTNLEHNFGLLRYDGTPKLAYSSMKKMYTSLKGKTFVKRLDSASDDILLLYKDSYNNQTVAAWSLNMTAHKVKLPDTQTISITDAPIFVNLIK